MVLIVLLGCSLLYTFDVEITIFSLAILVSTTILMLYVTAVLMCCTLLYLKEKLPGLHVGGGVPTLGPSKFKGEADTFHHVPFLEFLFFSVARTPSYLLAFVRAVIRFGRFVMSGAPLVRHLSDDEMASLFTETLVWK
jgi:hypothetical protein